MTRAIEGTVHGKRPAPIEATGLRQVSGIAKNKANLLAQRQQHGVRIAKDEIGSYRRARVPPSMFDQLIEIAFMMGVSGVAGVVAKYISKHVVGALAAPKQGAPGPAQTEGEVKLPASGPNPPSTVVSDPAKGDAPLGSFFTDGVKEGFKGVAKAAKRGGSSGGEEQSGQEADREEGTFSTNREIDFFARHEAAMIGLGDSYATVVDDMTALLEDVEPSKASAAIAVLAEAMDSAATVAAVVQASATELQWIASTARQSMGETNARLPDGSSVAVANLDKAREYGPRSWSKASGVPTHDGVLDIHVDLPVGSTPVEVSGFKVLSAAITGISQEAADRLLGVNLADAGIAIRLIVRGHPALITRDEIGRVRVNGYLLTTGQGVTWSEQQMHLGATFLVDQVLAKPLVRWGVKHVKSDDATERTNQVQQ
jgi:hypothetical protein